MFTKRTCGLPLVCLVCGEVARGINFNLMTCMSCKTFFRRHGIKQSRDLRCSRENDCAINAQTRSSCSACRLQKCLSLGMDPRLIGNRQLTAKDSTPAKSQILVKKRSCKERLRPSSLSLLENDRATLSSDDWELLSNIIHSYDATNIISQTIDRLQHQASLPPKIRSKPAIIFDILKPFYSTFQLLVERTPYYQTFSVSARQELAYRNCEFLAYLNSLFVLRETHALDYPAFRTGTDLIYSPHRAKTYRRLMSQFDFDYALVRIILLVTAFSPSCATVSFDSSADISWNSNSIAAFHIQNVFLTIFWKYLLHHFGFTRAVQWVDSCVRFLVQAVDSLSEPQGLELHPIVEEVVEDVSRLSVIDD